MTSALRLGIAGLGVVGAGVVKIIQKHADLVAQRAGRPVEIVCVSAQSKAKDRGVDLLAYEWKTMRPPWRCARILMCWSN